MYTAIYLSVLFLLANSAGMHGYTGPKCLGPFCIDHKVPARRLFKQLGTPRHKVFFFQPYCYQSKNGRDSLYVETFHDQPDIASVVAVAQFLICTHEPRQITQDNLHAWKTREGIGLGSLEKDVVRAYGKPSSEEKIDTNNINLMKALIYGYKPGDAIPPVGDKTLFYHGDASVLSAAEFCIRNGKVSCIWLSYDE